MEERAVDPDNSFRVDLPSASAWATLLDIPSVVPCLPGAELLAVAAERTYRGQLKVKLGNRAPAPALSEFSLLLDARSLLFTRSKEA